MEVEVDIPLFRAKKIDSDEYAEGEYAGGLIHSHRKAEMVDPSTLAIHFPDMIDSEGTKIFASLSENGKGGDNFKAKSIFTEKLEECVFYFDKETKAVRVKELHNSITWEYGSTEDFECKSEIKVTGIQE